MVQDEAGLSEAGQEVKGAILAFMQQNQFQAQTSLSTSEQARLRRRLEAGTLRASVQARIHCPCLLSPPLAA